MILLPMHEFGEEEVLFLLALYDRLDCLPMHEVWTWAIMQAVRLTYPLVRYFDAYVGQDTYLDCE